MRFESAWKIVSEYMVVIESSTSTVMTAVEGSSSDSSSSAAVAGAAAGVTAGGAASAGYIVVDSSATQQQEVIETVTTMTEVVHVQYLLRSGGAGVRGVNLGGWLVAEQWMSSESDIWRDMAEGASSEGEFQVLMHGNNHEQRLANFEKHHSTFITEADIAAIAMAGFNMVRVPVGWWILGEDHDDAGSKSEMAVFSKNTVRYLDTLVREWVVRYNLAVLVDIHAAKSSQNGGQHSAPPTAGVAYWGKYPENVRNTVLLAKFIGDRYQKDDAFLGVGLLNDPAADTDKQYYQDAYQAVRESGNECVLAIMPYRYNSGVDSLAGFMEAPTHKNVLVEWATPPTPSGTSCYIWGHENGSADELVNKTILTDFQSKVLAWTSRANANKLFLGEWTLANAGQIPQIESAEFA